MSSGRREGQRFDADYGVTTEALLFLGELDPQAIGPALADATHYEAVPVTEFTRLLDAVPPPLERYTFVDAGSGMGRAVMLASRSPFRQVVGVEVSAALHAIACENLATWRTRGNPRCRDIRLRHSDAAAYAFPRGDLVLFLYNPFGAQTTRRVLARAAASRAPGEELILVYHTPVHTAALPGRPSLEPVARFAFGVVYRMRSSGVS